ncbi:MAG: hypothetical protein H6834_12480 [Planctomycetes bacterium]|nr:hypothetical protein [Planctomycetota bacterium]
MQGPTAHVPQNPWILGPARDLVFVILTPLLVLPVLLGVRGLLPDQRIYEAVMAFGALGHHLPGMMRAYGDRELFARFRTRFIMAPIALAILCAWSSVEGLHAMAVVALGWGLWHGWMQVHGFARIYDAKAGSLERRTAYLDLAFVSTWFVALVIFSPYRLAQLADVLSRCGVPSPTANAISTLRWIAVGSVTLVSVAFAGHAFARWRTGRPQSVLKHVFLVTTIAAFAYATCFVENLILGIAVFEILHDVQYLAIVWAFNRTRVAKGVRTGLVTRLMFGGTAFGVAVYLALIASYGALGPLSKTIESESFRNAVLGLLVASQLLHFYYDGFIWKMREGTTRQALGIAGHDEGTPGVRSWTAGLTTHGAKWAVGFIPVLWILSVEDREGSANVPALRSALELAVDDPDALRKFGLELRDRGDHPSALNALRRAAVLRSDDQEVRDDLARLLAELGQDALVQRDDVVRATEWIREARVQQPRIHEALLPLGQALLTSDPRRAVATFRLAFLAAPESTVVRLAWVRVLAQFQQYRQALDVLTPFLLENPTHAEARELERRLHADWRRSPR